MVIIQKMAANDEGQASGSADGPSVSSRPEDVAGPSTAVPNQAGTEREKRRMRRRELTKKRLRASKRQKERKMKKRTEMVKNKMSDFVNSIIIICFRVTYRDGKE